MRIVILAFYVTAVFSFPVVKEDKVTDAQEEATDVESSPAKNSYESLMASSYDPNYFNPTYKLTHPEISLEPHLISSQRNHDRNRLDYYMRANPSKKFYEGLYHPINPSSSKWNVEPSRERNSERDQHLSESEEEQWQQMINFDKRGKPGKIVGAIEWAKDFMKESLLWSSRQPSGINVAPGYPHDFSEDPNSSANTDFQMRSASVQSPARTSKVSQLEMTRLDVF